MIARDLADYLQSNAIGTVGTDIFVGEMPKDPLNAIMVMSDIAEEPDRYLDTQYAHLSLWCRDASTKTGWDRLTAVSTLLHRQHHLTLGRYYAYFIHATGGIEDLDRDSEGRKLLRLRLRIIYRNTDLVS